MGTLPSGGPEELCGFLAASLFFLSARRLPPSKEDFKLFLEGGWLEVNEKNVKAGTSYANPAEEGGMERHECIDLIRTQAESFKKLLDENQKCIESLSLGAETDVGLW